MKLIFLLMLCCKLLPQGSRSRAVMKMKKIRENVVKPEKNFECPKVDASVVLSMFAKTSLCFFFLLGMYSKVNFYAYYYNAC